jgi:hypothetical protein
VFAPSRSFPAPAKVLFGRQMSCQHERLPSHDAQVRLLRDRRCMDSTPLPRFFPGDGTRDGRGG